jgi:lysozyme
MYEELAKQLAFEEGRKLRKYKCTAGHWTIGIGHNLDAKPTNWDWVIPDVITDTECDAIFNTDVRDVSQSMVKAFPGLARLSPPRRDAVLNMAFQMGTSGVMKFKGMIAALVDKDWQRARACALDSAWAKQTPQRAARVANQLLTGEYYKV